MAIKKYNPTSPGRRFMSVSEFEESHSDKTRKIASRSHSQIGRQKRARKDYRPSYWRRKSSEIQDY